MKFQIYKLQGKWQTVPAAKGPFDTIAEADEECGKRNGFVTPAYVPPVKPQLTDEQIDAMNKRSLESGSGIILPTTRNLDQKFDRLSHYNDEPPED